MKRKMSFEEGFDLLVTLVTALAAGIAIMGTCAALEGKTPEERERGIETLKKGADLALIPFQVRAELGI